MPLQSVIVTPVRDYVATVWRRTGIVEHDLWIMEVGHDRREKRDRASTRSVERTLTVVGGRRQREEGGLDTALRSDTLNRT